MRVVTDSTPLEDPKDPEKCNVFSLYRLFVLPEEAETMADRYKAGGFGYAEAKQSLFDTMWTCFEPFRKRRKELKDNLSKVESILQEGAERARAVARKTLDTARSATGLT